MHAVASISPATARPHVPPPDPAAPGPVPVAPVAQGQARQSVAATLPRWGAAVGRRLRDALGRGESPVSARDLDRALARIADPSPRQRLRSTLMPGGADGQTRALRDLKKLLAHLPLEAGRADRERALLQVATHFWTLSDDARNAAARLLQRYLAPEAGGQDGMPAVRLPEVVHAALGAQDGHRQIIAQPARLAVFSALLQRGGTDGLGMIRALRMAMNNHEAPDKLDEEGKLTLLSCMVRAAGTVADVPHVIATAVGYEGLRSAIRTRALATTAQQEAGMGQRQVWSECCAEQNNLFDGEMRALFERRLNPPPAYEGTAGAGAAPQDDRIAATGAAPPEYARLG